MTDVLDHDGVARRVVKNQTNRSAKPEQTEVDDAVVNGEGEQPTRAWSREEAEALRAREPQVSPWMIVAAQALTGLLCGLLAMLLFGQAGIAWSALYGAAVVVLPSALLARGMSRRTRSPVAAAAVFMFWEMLKIGVAIVMLAIAVRVVPHLSWPALLVVMVVCTKVHWVALLWRHRRLNDKA